MKYTDLPAQEKPAVRIKELGAQSLTNQELLAVALRINETETAAALAALYNERGRLSHIDRREITSIPGLGGGYADSIQAICEIARREVVAEVNQRMPVQSPSDAAGLVSYEMSALDHEQLRIILLDTRNKVIRVVKLYDGSLNASMVRVGEVFREALLENAAGIILVHNHPSGDPTPSPEDVSLTRTVVSAGRLMDVAVLDHLVIGGGGFVSLKERGLGFA